MALEASYSFGCTLWLHSVASSFLFSSYSDIGRSRGENIYVFAGEKGQDVRGEKGKKTNEKRPSIDVRGTRKNL